MFEDVSTDVATFHKTGNQVSVNWVAANYPGAELFDLEYTVIDSSSAAGNSLQNNFYSGGTMLFRKIRWLPGLLITVRG
ncbi:hypothetical protein [Paraflavitalea speifideaquila]|uniref:hypothetical protein n=1 Tax=Paraflavitalea speifideaquila TaxID=3076558 RepID=UPI0028E92BC3|nr:hypothetical protein [Paraflavitalea speifideiaquila]